jgi:ADP-heptose:LPS heptosyltransferase
MIEPRSILVCRLSALGDIVLTLPAVEALRERFPQARLAFLARSPYGRVLAGVRANDEHLTWDGGGAPPPAAALGREWDLLIDLSATGRSRQLLGRVRAVRRLRVRKQTLRRFAFVKLRALGGGSVALQPTVDRMFSGLAPLGLEREGRVPRFDVPPAAPDAPVVVAPGAGRDTKRWPEEHFAEVVRAIAAGGLQKLSPEELEAISLASKVACHQLHP